MEVQSLRGITADGVLREKYRLLRQIGEGAFGLTFIAEHLFLRHPCVVKILPLSLTEPSAEAVERLRQEARSGFLVSDPNVVRVLDCDVVNGTWYFVMEYVEGFSLAEILASGARFPWEQAAGLARQILSGVDAIHNVGLIHCDIKPGNLLLDTSGRVRVADLGVASVARRAGGYTPGATHVADGTLSYAAPEVHTRERPVEIRSDLYSVGATLFEMLTGQPPLQRRSIFQHLVDQQNRLPQWPAADEETPEWLQTMVLRTLDPDPEKRPRAAAGLITEIQRLLGESTLYARPSREKLRARGIGILPLQNAVAGGADWLGFALADDLRRSLSNQYRQYVVDPDRLQALVRPSGNDERLAELIHAAPRLGAATVLEGRFRLEDETIGVELRIHRSDSGDAPPTTVTAEGTLPGLAALQADLLAQVVDVLRLSIPGSGTSAAPAQVPEVSAEMLERFTRAKRLYIDGRYSEAITLAEEALEFDSMYGEAAGFVGICHARRGEYEDAERWHRRHEEIARALQDTRQLVETQANLGVMNYFRGEYSEALECYRTAAELADKLGLALERAQIYNNLGFVLLRLGRLAEVEGAFRQAIETHRAHGALLSLVGPYNGLGNVFLEQKRYDEARSYFRRALMLALETGDRANIGTSHMNLANCAALEGRFDDAKHEFAMALNALEETTFWNGLARAYEYMANMNIRLRDLPEALRCADERIQLAGRHSNLRIEAGGWRQKAEALRLARREAEALACERRAAELDPSESGGTSQ